MKMEHTIGTGVSADPSTFVPAWWCRGGHLQTLWSGVVRAKPALTLTRERLELPDGDFIDLDWSDGGTARPLVIVLHGLEGSSRSSYALGLLAAVNARGWRGVVVHHRGCSGEPNRLPRTYHSGDTNDLDYVMNVLREREPDVKKAIVGYSLGANVLLNWLANAPATSISAAVAVSPTFEIAKASARLNRGFSRIYQWHFLRKMRQSILAKRNRFAMPVDYASLRHAKSFREFDDLITAPLHGFKNADHFYATASPRQRLHRITVDTLVVCARNDPFSTPDAIPRKNELSRFVELDLQRDGGHVGFVGGRWPWHANYWLETRIPQYLQQHFRR